MISLSPELVEGGRLEDPPIRHPRPFLIHIIPDPDRDERSEIRAHLEPKYHAQAITPCEECPSYHPIDPKLTSEGLDPIDEIGVCANMD